MKKLFLITLTVITIAACSKVADQVVPEVQTPSPGKYIFTLKASVADLTKTSYEGERYFSWDAHDKISVLFHDGETHRFYDLETVAGAAHGESAVFSGEIDEGFTLGASETDGGKQWALYPAGSHTWDSANDRPVYNIPEVTDFTVADHISSNIPMAYSKGSSTTNFSFVPIACPYKISFKNVDVSKVRLTVTHSSTHKMSGNFTMENSSSNAGLWAQGSSGSDQSISYIKNVAGDKTVSFYFSIPRWGESSFRPIITLKDESTGYILYYAQATKEWVGDEDLAPSHERMVVLPAIPASGTGSPFVSAYGRNWGAVSAVADGSTADGKDAIIQIKADADASYLYLYFAVNAARMHSDASYKYSNHWDWYFGDAESSSSTVWTDKRTIHVEGWIKKRNVITLTEWNDNMESNFSQVGDVIYVEQKVKRSAYACLQGTSCKVGLLITAQALNEAEETVVTATQIGYGPVDGGSMLSVTMPTYVAP